MSKAIVLTQFGDPSVLQWEQVDDPSPGPGEVLIRVRAAGVGPTDLNIRAGHLAQVFPQTSGSILGFEAAGTVAAIGEGVSGIKVGDDVAASLPAQGGYAELVTATKWFPKPPEVSWTDAAALPASAEAAVEGETLVVLGGAGSVGLLVLQIARTRGLRVVASASEQDAQLIRDLGGLPVLYGPGAFERIRQVTSTVHAVVDAAGKGGLLDAVAATGNPSRVVTLSDAPGAAESGAHMLEAGPDREPDALAVTMPLLAAGTLTLKTTMSMPMTEAAEAHRLLEAGKTHSKIILVVP